MSDSRHRPRLLVLASTFPASATDSAPAFVRDLAQYEARHFDTTVLVPSLPGALRREHVGSVAVHRFRYFPRRWEDLANGAILENLRSQRSRWLQVPTLMAAEFAATRRLVKSIRPDVIHAHWIIPQGLVAALAAPSVPMLVTTLGGDLYGLRDPASRRVIRAVLRHAAAATAMNEDMRDQLVNLGSARERTSVLPMGADIESIRSIAANESTVRGRILFVGRLVEKKGLHILLEAMRRDGASGCHLVVVGDGPLRGALAEAAANLPVSFVGALDRNALAREYGRAEVVVFPSVQAASGDQDGLPVAMLEAMAAGCPVLASDLPGLREAIREGDSGMLVSAGGVDSLARGLRRLLDDQELRYRLGQGASERSESYSVAALGARYIELLDGIRTNRPAAGASP